MTIGQNSNKFAYYAHSPKNDSGWQLLSDHSNNVGVLVSQIVSKWSPHHAEASSVLGKLHDVGKYTKEVQNMIRGEKIRVDHSTHGAKILQEKYPIIGKYLSCVIAGHHAGLQDSMETRFKKELPQIDPIWEKEISIPENIDEFNTFFKHISQNKQTQMLSLMSEVRFLFSALVSADTQDVVNFYNSQKKQSQFDSIEVLSEKFDTHMSGFKGEGEVSKIRAEILARAKEKGLDPQGVFTFTSPTGSGKTLSSLAFGLEHAKKHNLHRIIFAIPFTSITQQTADVYKRIFGKHNVLEHHSNFSDYDSESDYRKHMGETLNWDAPIIVTTTVQLFDSLYSNKRRDCSKLHNMTNSVIIVDETQSIPTTMYGPIVHSINDLVNNRKSSVVLCTATQPTIGRVSNDQIFQLSEVSEIAAHPKDLPELFKKMHRVSVEWMPNNLTVRDFAATLDNKHQALVVVNSKKIAANLYLAIKSSNKFHLSTNMTPTDRREVLKEVIKRLSKNEPCVLVSTSLIEAGIDVDFPVVYRQLTGLQSIAQAAGRCNREGKRKIEDSKVYVFDFTKEEGSNFSLESQRSALLEWKLLFGREDIFSPRSIEKFYRLLDSAMIRRDEVDKSWDIGTHGEKFADKVNSLCVAYADKSNRVVPYETVAKNVRLIKTNDVSLIINNNPIAQNIVNQLEGHGTQGEKWLPVSASLQDHVVAVREKMFDKLVKSGHVQFINESEYGKQYPVFVQTSLDTGLGVSYTNDLGLNIVNKE